MANTPISTILAAMTTIQAGLAVTTAGGAPADASIVKAHPFPLDWNELPNWSVPAFFNTYDLVRLEYGVSYLERLWTITTQCVVADARREVAAEMATHFLEEWLQALVADTTLTATVNLNTVRGGSPTLGAVNLNGVEFVAVTLLVDARTKGAQDFG